MSPPPPPSPLLPSLVYYAAISKGSSSILAEYAPDPSLPDIALQCLQNVPPLHSRFSYATNHRRFVCILDGMFSFCAIMDEALRKSDAFSFLLTVRDAFKSSLQGRVSRSQNLTLGAHFLDDEIVPLMRRLAADLVGVPQRDKLPRTEAQLLVPRDIEVDLEVSTSPSAVAPLYEMSDQDFDAKTEEKPHGSRSPGMLLINKALQTKKKVKDQVKEMVMEQGKKIEVLVDAGCNPMAANSSSRSVNINHDNNDEDIEDEGSATGGRGPRLAQRIWHLNVKFVILLDVAICLLLLVIWLGVCHGISCVKK